MAKEEKFVARHLIPMTLTPGKAGDKAKGIAPVAPKVKEVKPGERIMLDPEDAETKFLLANGAIVKADADDDRAPAKAAAPAKKAAAKDDGAGEGDGDDGKDGELV